MNEKKQALVDLEGLRDELLFDLPLTHLQRRRMANLPHDDFWQEAGYLLDEGFDDPRIADFLDLLAKAGV
ncbi:MAG: hypothetical protein JNM18_12510 [Planctomycetaceae bacterium]|nr:hypothetical protein [Planctomycetaceae bacterium]